MQISIMLEIREVENNRNYNNKNRHLLSVNPTEPENECKKKYLNTLFYGAEKQTLTSALIHNFKLAQRETERFMGGVSLMNQIWNEVK